jgi:hypothetical protein
MKKYLNIKVFCMVTAGFAAIVALTVGNISAFLGWLSASIYALNDYWSEDCM